MGSPENFAEDLSSRFREEVRRNARTTGLIAGVVAIVCFPAWSAFDWLVVPEKAPEFTAIRIFSVIPIALLWGALFTRAGRRRPELLILGMLSIIQLAIALMIGRLESDFAAYALGFSAALFGSAFLLTWPARYSAALVAISFCGLVLLWILPSGGVSGSEFATVAFFVFTASIVTIVGQVIRQRASFREFSVRVELEGEQERSRLLVDELETLSREDGLTGIANRRAWDEALELECGRAERDGRALSVVLCDIDRLKDLNDIHGHAVGDAVIRATAEVIASRARAADVAARIGGDEFAILLAGTDLKRAAILAESLRARIESLQLEVDVTVSVGVAEWEREGDAASALMLRADRRLYAAKHQRNSVATSVDIKAA